MPPRRSAACITHYYIISDVSKLEGWWMASIFQCTMHITNSHFKTFFRASCSFTGPKTPKIRPKKGPKAAQRGPRDTVWYQTKALHEHSVNKLFWQQINIHKVPTSAKNTIFGSKTAIFRPLINLKMTTFSIKPTLKILLALYTTTTNTISSYIYI